MLALQQGTDPLQPHAGVDRLHVQGPQRAICELLVLHEDVVPDLDEPVTVFLRRAGRPAPDMLAVVIENLGARAARPGRPHAPEVIIAGDADDPAVRQTRDLFPDISGLVIGVIDRDQQLILVQPEILGQQLPGKGNRLILEVVAKAEVPQHFKERMVPCGIAHVVQIVVLAACADAFLRRCRPFVIARLHPGEQVLELHHARVGEHQRRIIARNQRAAVHLAVTIAFKEIKIGRADVVQARHVREPFGFFGVGPRLAPPFGPVHGFCPSCGPTWPQVDEKGPQPWLRPKLSADFPPDARL